jgi:hypothetical protein
MRKLLAVSVILLLAAGTAAAQGKNSGACDRACLEGMVNQYLSAMVAHDPSKAPFAKNLKFTENAVKLPPTEGLLLRGSLIQGHNDVLSRDRGV